jgi:pimeloyl-ACP methyl ester carboxylesterase
MLCLSLCALIIVTENQVRDYASPKRTTPDGTLAVAVTWFANEVNFETSDGITLNGWYMPPPTDREVYTDGASMIFVHDHGRNWGQFLEVAPQLNRNGYGILLFDLRNHGESGGDLTTMGFNEVRDIEAAFEFLSTQDEVDPERIGIYGIGMGAATAIRAMVRIPKAKLLIADTAYESFNALVEIEFTTSMSYIIKWTAEVKMGVDLDQVQPIDDIGQIASRPVLIIHGTLDPLVWHSRHLFAVAREPKELAIVEEYSDDWGYIRREEYVDRLLGFLDKYL